MDNKEITIFLSGEYRNINFNNFINSFINTFFFMQDKKVIEKLLFIPLKIKEEDRKDILDEFRNQIIILESYLKNNQSDKNYKNNLYNYLHHLNFSSLNQNQKIFIIKSLNIPQFLHNSILKDFTKSK